MLVTLVLNIDFIIFQEKIYTYILINDIITDLFCTKDALEVQDYIS